jgi:hypothetical protein
MKNYGLATLLATLMLASFLGCTNDRKSEKEALQDTSPIQKHEETWEDIEKRKDSLWAIICESTDVIEVERAREMFLEMASNAEWYMLVEKDYEKYKDRVEEEFQHLVEALPDYKNLFLNEKEKWEHYHEAVLAMISLEDHGSSGTLNIIGALNQSLDLWSASFHNLLLHKQSQDVSFPHTKFTSRMIEDAYKAFFDEATDNWYNPYTDDSKEGLEEYQATASNERKMWNEWMKYRTIVAKALPKELREVYNGCTNLMMRTKLHQLKNQNAGLGLMSDDVSDCLLPDSCSEKALLNYPGLNVVLEKHSEDLNWYPVFE